MSSFLDTNVLLYLLQEGPKAARSKELVTRGGTISVQVLTEFTAVARRKFKLTMDEIVEALDPVIETCTIADDTLAVHERAIEIARLTNFSFFDCTIAAAAELAGCDVLYTEDMNHGQRVGGVAIRNPFVKA
jgi:predicted nucleic acid-binding protein